MTVDAAIRPFTLRLPSPIGELLLASSAHGAGTLRAFGVPTDVVGTPFQQRVWSTLRTRDRGLQQPEPAADRGPVPPRGERVGRAHRLVRRY